MKALLLALVLSGCAPKNVVYRPNYAYMETAPGEFYILVRSDQGKADALKALKCGVCAEGFVGYVWVVTVPK